MKLNFQPSILSANGISLEMRVIFVTDVTLMSDDCNFTNVLRLPVESYAGHVVVKARIGMPHESSEDVMDCRCEKT